jgi:hypothetical protein
MRIDVPKGLGTLGKVAVSVGLLLFLLSRLDRAQLLSLVSRAQPIWLIAALSLYFLAILLGILKWYVLVRAQRLGASYSDLAAYTFIGLFLGNVLPSNIGGDIVRAVGLTRATPDAAEVAMMSVIVDRLLGLSAYLTAALVNVVLVALLLSDARSLETLEIAVVLAAGAFVCGCALFFSRRVARRLAVCFEWGPLARFQANARRIYRAIQSYRCDYGALAVNVVLSASIIVVATLGWYSIALALHLEIPLVYFFLFNPLIAFVLLLPISLNGLGPKEATTVFFFGLVGVPSESAFAMSLLFHGVVVLASLPGGIWWLRGRARAHQGQ